MGMGVYGNLCVACGYFEVGHFEDVRRLSVWPWLRGVLVLVLYCIIDVCSMGTVAGWTCDAWGCVLVASFFRGVWGPVAPRAC